MDMFWPWNHPTTSRLPVACYCEHRVIKSKSKKNLSGVFIAQIISSEEKILPKAPLNGNQKEVKR